MGLLDEHGNYPSMRRPPRLSDAAAERLQKGLLSAFPMLGKDPQNVTMDDLMASGVGAMPMSIKLIKNLKVLPLADDGYKGVHKAPGKDFGAPLHDLTAMYPDDIYSRNAPQYYGEGRKYDRKAFDVLRKYKDSLDALVDIYRAVPEDVTQIYDSDWVTTVKEYAKDHGYAYLGDDYNILHAKVPAKKLFTDANSPYEFGIDLAGMLAAIGIIPGLLSERPETDAVRYNER